MAFEMLKLIPSIATEKLSDCGIWLQEIMAFIRSYVVPEGFPDSVTPSYVPYMTWRALKVYCRIMFTNQSSPLHANKSG